MSGMKSPFRIRSASPGSTRSGRHKSFVALHGFIPTTWVQFRSSKPRMRYKTVVLEIRRAKTNQRDSKSGFNFEPEGREFESLRARHSFFVDINPECRVPHPSLLCVRYRNLRMISLEQVALELSFRFCGCPTLRRLCEGWDGFHLLHCLHLKPRKYLSLLGGRLR